EGAQERGARNHEDRGHLRGKDQGSGSRTDRCVAGDSKAMKKIVETGEEPLCTALLVPMPVEALKRAAEKLWRKKHWSGADPPEFEVIAGRGAYSALVDREPGSEGCEDDLAKHLVRTVAGPIYSLNFDVERVYHVRVFQRGKPIDWREHED